MAGFTLSFGSMFSKTWRVHSIFTNVQLNKKVQHCTASASKTSPWSWWLSGDEGLAAVPGGGRAPRDGHHHHDHLAAGRPLLQGDQRAQTICEDNHHRCHHSIIVTINVCFPIPYHDRLFYSSLSMGTQTSSSSHRTRCAKVIGWMCS